MDGYQGYSNRETWALCLRLSNDRTAYDFIRSQINEIRLDLSSHMPGDARFVTAVRHKVEDFLKEMLEEAYAEDLTNISRDMFDLIREVGSLWRVDWREVAEEFLSD